MTATSRAVCRQRPDPSALARRTRKAPQDERPGPARGLTSIGQVSGFSDKAGPPGSYIQRCGASFSFLGSGNNRTHQFFPSLSEDGGGGGGAICVRHRLDVTSFDGRRGFACCGRCVTRSEERRLLRNANDVLSRVRFVQVAISATCCSPTTGAPASAGTWSTVTRSS